MVISEDGSVEWLSGGVDLADRGANEAARNRFLSGGRNCHSAHALAYYCARINWCRRAQLIASHGEFEQPFSQQQSVGQTLWPRATERALLL